MKYLFLSVLLVLGLCASDEQKKLEKAKVQEQTLSEQEKQYQADRKKLEQENQKLEEDGFCSCNNN